MYYSVVLNASFPLFNFPLLPQMHILRLSFSLSTIIPGRHRGDRWTRAADWPTLTVELSERLPES